MSNNGMCSPHVMGSSVCLSTQHVQIERELENQIKESFVESQALQKRFHNDLESIREDSERRLAGRLRLSKKQEAKWKQRILCVRQDKADVLQQAKLLQDEKKTLLPFVEGGSYLAMFLRSDGNLAEVMPSAKVSFLRRKAPTLVVSTSEVRLARNRIFELESEAQVQRARPPQVVEIINPGSVTETVRWRDKAVIMEEQARLAQRAEAEAREAIGRESAVTQGLQRDIDNARHRLLTVQGSLAEAFEENAGLKRELEAERVKTAAGSRRLADAVDHQENSLAEVRRDSAQLRKQRDNFAQDLAVFSIKLHQLEKQKAAAHILYALSRTHCTSMARALRFWMIMIMDDIHSKKQARRQKEHNSEVTSLEADLSGIKARCRDMHRRNEMLRNSREGVADAVAVACRRRGCVATAVEERGASILRWCFWGWARVAWGECAATATRVRRIEAESELTTMKDILQASIEKLRGAENERERYKTMVAMLSEENNQGKAELGRAHVAQRTTQSLVLALGNRYIHLGAARVRKALRRYNRKRLALSFSLWFETGQVSASTPAEKLCRLAPATAAENITSEKHSATQRLPTDKTQSRLKSAPEVITPRVRSSGSGPPSGKGAIQGASPVALGMGGGLKLDNGEERTFKMTKVNEYETYAQLSTPLKETPGQGEQEADSDADSHAPTGYSSRHSSCSASCIKPWSCDMTVDLIHTERCGIEKQKATPEHDDGNCRDDAWLSRGTPMAAEGFTDETIASQCDTLGSFVSATASEGRYSPHFMLALRTAVGEELYAVGERLLRCVEADHREIYGRPYHPIPVTGAERDQFHACLSGASHGSLRNIVVTFLQAQESFRALAVERDRETNRPEAVCSDVRARADGALSWGGRFCLERRNAKGERRVEEWKDKEAKYDGWRRNISSLTTGPLSNPEEKARAARVLRDRLIALLGDVSEVWESHRRQWKLVHPEIARDSREPKRAISNSSKARSLRNRTGQRSSESRLPCLDSGAGPRKFWKNMAGPSFVEASWSVGIKALDKQLWKLAMLVREQDSGQRLALRRCEGLRRVLDMRIYELLLLHVRTQLIWDGIDIDSRSGTNLEVNHDTTLASSIVDRSKVPEGLSDRARWQRVVAS